MFGFNSIDYKNKQSNQFCRKELQDLSIKLIRSINNLQSSQNI